MAEAFNVSLNEYTATVRSLPGIASGKSRDAFIAQLVDSDRRRRYAERVRAATPDSKVLGDPISAFDPLFAAVLKFREGDFDEACWLVMLATHFGYHRTNRWSLSGHFYRRLGDGSSWTWPTIVADPPGMRAWLDEHRSELRRLGGPFGNHRKFESLSGTNPSGTGEVLESYIGWVGESHRHHFEQILVADSPKKSFAAAYASMNAVTRFGRIGRFDYLTMLQKLGIVEFVPDKLYLQGATGPLQGARLMCCGSEDVNVHAAELEGYLKVLGDMLGVFYDVLEDALCNWQKSPRRFTSFRG